MRIKVWLAAGLLALLCGCGGSEIPEATPELTPTPTPTPAAAEFTLPRYTASDWSPLDAGSGSNLTLMPLIYEGLFVLDGSFEARPALCETYSFSEDTLVWTLTLREGVTFSDGTPLTASIARQSLLAAMGEGSLYAGRLGCIRAVTAADDRTLVITLNRPNANLGALLDVPVFYDDGEQWLGTGPYRLEGDRLVARRDWWQGGTMPLEEIPLYDVGSAEELIYGFDTGEIGLVTADWTGSGSVGFSGNYESWDYQTTDLLFIGYNCADGPCEDPLVRAALGLGFDREGLATSVLAGHGTAAVLPAHPLWEEYDEELADTAAYSLENLEAALDAGGYVPGNDGVRRKGRDRLELVLIVNTDNSFKVSAAEALATALGEAGVAVTVEKLAWEQYLNALETGQFDLYLGQVRMTADFDPGVLIEKDGGLNYGGFESPELAAALEQARRTGSWSGFYALFLEEAPFVPLCFKEVSVLTQWGRVKGVEPLQSNVFNGFYQWKIDQ